MDNRTLDVISEGEEALALALQLVWPNASGGYATAYKVASLIQSGPERGLIEKDGGCPTLILLWEEERGTLPLAYPHDLKEATRFVFGWLRRADYGPEPDHDGHNQKGFRVFNEQWGHVAGYCYAIVGIQPAWAMYGK